MRSSHHVKLLLSTTIISASLLVSLGTIAQDSTSRSKLELSGFVEGYYSYDLNKPQDNKRPDFLYNHNRHNEFNINLAFLKSSYISARTRANLAIAVGTYMNANYAAEPGVLKNIYEANAGYKLSGKKNLWFDIGIMPSHIGFESAQSPGCWTLTRSLAAENSPYFETGAKLTYTTDDGKWMVSAMALNGWQRIQRVDGNSLMSWGTQVLYKPSGNIAINYSTFIGSDKPDSARLWRYFHNVYGIFQINDKIGLIAGFDIGMEQKNLNDDGYNTWYTPVGILRYAPYDKWAIGLRAEYYSDKDGVIIQTGSTNGFQTVGASLNIDYLPMQHLALRLEARYLDSKDAIFSKDGTAKNNNTAITFSTAISL